MTVFAEWKLFLYYFCPCIEVTLDACNLKISIAMFTVIKRMEISASHKLVLPYRSKCASLHGHNWIITVYCRSARLNSEGMVVDFTRIKEVVMEKLDHQNLNEVLPFNPTAENIARWVCRQIPQCYKVEVQESEGNTVIYEKDTAEEKENKKEETGETR